MCVSSHKYKQLSITERTKIELWHELGKSSRWVAQKLHRSPVTISRELVRGTYNGKYWAHIANDRAKDNRLNNRKPKRSTEQELMAFIERRLKERHSPEIIAHDWNELVMARIIVGDTITAMTIYGIIKTIRTEWAKYLIYHKKRKYHKGLASKKLIPDRMDIAGRGEIEFGDWEADTVIGIRGSKSCLGVFVEHTSRLYKIVKMANKTADEMVLAAKKALNGLHIRSITYDNGGENAKHGVINKMFGCVSWFCRAYCSTDKPLIENRNKILRQFLPKKTNFDLINESELARIEAAINNRPMKTLDWLSPSQAYLIASTLHFYL